MELVYPPVVAGVVALFRIMNWSVTVEGAEHIPTDGPALIATNHVGYLDFTFVGYAARPRGRLVRFMAKREVFEHPLAGPLMRGMKHVPVNRFGRATDAFQEAVERLALGQVLGLFPEGTINRSFVPGAGKTGAGRIAAAAAAPLVPGAVWGSQRLLTKGRSPNWQRGVAVTVSFGEPLHPVPGDDPGDVTRALMRRISGLVEHAATTYPQEPADDGDRWWLPAHLGGSAPTVDQAQRLATQERIERRRKRRAERS